MHEQAEILTIMQGWRCNSKAYGKFHLFFCCICALASLLCGLAVLTRQGDSESLVTCVFALIGSFIFFTLYKNKRHNIKQVRFTPEAVYIEGLKLDMSYLKSVEYITTLRNIHKDVIAIELSMTFFLIGYVMITSIFIWSSEKIFFLVTRIITTTEHASSMCCSS